MRWFRAGDAVDRQLERANSRLISETEAFMAGELAGRLRRQKATVPGWARLNFLAHGDLQRLRVTRRLGLSRRSTNIAELTEESWGSAQLVLARELFELVGNDPCLLADVQRRVLVPLELQLMEHESLTAFELVQFTRAALRSGTL